MFKMSLTAAPVGDVTMPVRTRFGYHIIHVTDRIEALGKIQAAHINVRIAQSGTKEDSLNARKKVDEIYNQIKSGLISFEDAAKSTDNDQLKVLDILELLDQSMNG